MLVKTIFVFIAERPKQRHTLSLLCKVTSLTVTHLTAYKKRNNKAGVWPTFSVSRPRMTFYEGPNSPDTLHWCQGSLTSRKTLCERKTSGVVSMEAYKKGVFDLRMDAI
jgi:hypothetical protein